MKWSFRFSSSAVLAVFLLVTGGGCTSGNIGGDPSPSSGGAAGDQGSSGGSGGNAGSSSSSGRAGASGSAGATGRAGAGGSAGAMGGAGGDGRSAGSPGRRDAAGAAPNDASSAAVDGGSAAMDGAVLPPGPGAWGGVGETPYVPLQYTDAPVPPIIQPDCPDDPTEGFTEYQAAFRVQRPHDLAADDRFSYKDGIYTFWVRSNDRAHTTSSGTEPRTEARYENFSTGEHIWSADVMYESVSRTCIMQIHNVVGAIAVYFRVTGNRMFNLASGQTILNNYRGKWFNLKVAFNTQTLQVKTYVNNCLKATSRSPRGPTPDWYFKHGVYTCDSGTCRSHYKNIHLYHRGATPPPPAIQR